MGIKNLYWNVILKRPKLIIGFFIFLLTLSIIILTQVKFQFAFEPKNILSPQEYKELHGDMQGPPRESLALILELPEHKPLTIDKLRDLTLTLTQLPEIQFAVSEATLPPSADPKFFRINDNTSWILLEPAQAGFLSIQDSRKLYDLLNKTIASHLEDTQIDFKLVGATPTRVALHESFARELLIVTLPLALLILLLPFLIYRSWSYVFLPGLAGLITVLVTLSLYGLFGKNFTYFSITLAPLLLCLSLMDAMYLVDRYWSKLKVEETHEMRLRKSIKELIFPCALTTITTMVGFASLLVISNTPILQEYGLFAAIGIALALMIVFLLTPALLKYWPEPNLAFVKRSLKFGNIITATALKAWGHPKKVLVAFLLCLALGIYFLPRLSVEGSFENFFSENHPTQKNINLLKEHLGSLSPIVFTVYSTTPDKSRRLHFLQVTHAFGYWLNTLPFIKWSLSPLTFMPKLETKRHPNENIFSFKKRIGETIENYQLHDAAAKSGGWITIDASGELKTMRVIAWPKELNPEELDTLNRYLNNFNRTRMQEFRYHTGGPYFLQKTIEDRFLREVLQSLLLSGILVLLITLIPLRSWRLSFIFIVANCFPLILVAGSMSLAHIPFSLALIGLPCILFGIIVDDSIHTLWSFRKTRSIEETYNRKGRAIFITSILLTVAFSGQFLSIYKTNRQFGELAALGIIFAFLADLLLVPALIKLLMPFAWRKSIRPV